MTGFIGWIQFAGRRVMVERVRDEGAFQVVRLCVRSGSFASGHEIRIPRAFFEPCAPRPRDDTSVVLP